MGVEDPSDLSAAPLRYAQRVRIAGEPEEIRIPREDERPEVGPAEEPASPAAPEREAEPVPSSLSK